MPEALNIGGRDFVWGSRTYIVGVLNVTPDSFAGDGLLDVDAAVERGLAMCRAGADLIDVGGESTRPGFEPVSLAEEFARVCPVLEALQANGVAAPLSIDTTKPEVAEAAFCAGAALLNDINGLRGDPRLAEVAARHGVPVIAMHNQRGRPMAADPIAAVLEGFTASLACASGAGIAAERVILDPGFGFGWSARQNYEILARLRELRAAGRPILVGTVAQAHDRRAVRLAGARAAGGHRRHGRDRDRQRRRPRARPRCRRDGARRNDRRRCGAP